MLIEERSAIGEARRLSSKVAEVARLGESRRSKMELIVTELATNLTAHANGGEIILQLLHPDGGEGVEIIAIDRGPGIADLRNCLIDGYSKAGTRGCGLGAVKRLSDEFDIYSTQPQGTIVLSRLFRAKRALSRVGRPYAVISVPVAGETDCGDAWQVLHLNNGLAVVVIDGLGHGPLAAAAAAEAVEVFNRREFDNPIDYLEAAHGAMRATRGAAIGAAWADFSRHTLHHAGVGNISGSILDHGGVKRRSLVSFDGIVGSKIRKLQQFEYQWNRGDLLIMHSDGLSERWKLADYPGLAQADVSLIAAALYRDAKRARDDSTVLVARLQEN